MRIPEWGSGDLYRQRIGALREDVETAQPRRSLFRRSLLGEEEAPTHTPSTQEIKDISNAQQRKSRSQLLAGLRTAPKAAGSNTFSSTAPSTQAQHIAGLATSDLTPPQVLDNGQMDPILYAQLVATNRHLAEQQYRFQNQLVITQAAAQQFQGLKLSSDNQTQQQLTNPSMILQETQQEPKNNIQPVIASVAGAQAGAYRQNDQVIGQQNYS
jgi:hypothetical protein